MKNVFLIAMVFAAALVFSACVPHGESPNADALQSVFERYSALHDIMLEFEDIRREINILALNNIGAEYEDARRTITVFAFRTEQYNFESNILRIEDSLEQDPLIHPARRDQILDELAQIQDSFAIMMENSALMITAAQANDTDAILRIRYENIIITDSIISRIHYLLETTYASWQNRIQEAENMQRRRFRRADFYVRLDFLFEKYVDLRWIESDFMDIRRTASTAALIQGDSPLLNNLQNHTLQAHMAINRHLDNLGRSVNHDPYLTEACRAEALHKISTLNALIGRHFNEFVQPIFAAAHAEDTPALKELFTAEEPFVAEINEQLDQLREFIFRQKEQI
ncbi:MAG: hypothetical protein FWB96_11125 [Defluviitaleaceae bacterium]|nr:hypothetical protein [Defluviitaleaceae bacterium]MCL2263531.1 hypothetical protein [Defluviitaleaceae bacterium]